MFVNGFENFFSWSCFITLLGPARVLVRRHTIIHFLLPDTLKLIHSDVS